MRTQLFAVSILSLVLAPAFADPHKGTGAELFPSAEIKWRDGPPSLPEGAKVAVLEGDPSKEGPFVFRVKLPDGYRVPPHTHPKTERVTVISGTFNIGMGDKFDEMAGKAMTAGTYGHWPAGMKHFVWAKGETVLQFHGMGPWSIEYVNPEDDPRKQKKAIPEGPKSGPQVGDRIPGPVYALVCVDAQPDLVGKKLDFVERHGPKPVVFVFARDLNDSVSSLVQRLDEELAKNRAAKGKTKQGHAVVVLLSDDDGLESKLKDFGEKQNIKHLTVAINQSTGPPQWKVSRGADVTIILYEKFKVTRNHALRVGELKKETIAKMVADVSTHLGK